MCCHENRKQGHTLAEVISKFWGNYAQAYNPCFHLYKVAARLEHCDTPQMGRMLYACSHCHNIGFVNKKCRDRNCPHCNGYKQAQWIEKRKEEMLPTGYVHVVFTVPHELNPVFLEFREKFAKALFDAAWGTVDQFGRNKGMQLGAVGVLHTWGSNLSVHPHVHLMMPAGGISLRTKTWKNLPLIKSGDNAGCYFLFSVKAMSKVFFGKFMSILRELIGKESIDADIAKAVGEKNWNVFVKPATYGSDKLVEYLSHYISKTAISNARIKEITDDGVKFLYKDYSDGDKVKLMTLEGVEFLRRFFQHVPPKGHRRVRYLGFLASCNRKKLARLQESMGVKPLTLKKEQASSDNASSTKSHMFLLCPKCKCKTFAPLTYTSSA